MDQKQNTQVQESGATNEGAGATRTTGIQNANRNAKERCTRCGKPLAPNKVVLLELDQRSNTYHDLRDVPDDKSQGWFPFGADCAKIERFTHTHVVSP